jgi:hypothetical protein
MGVQQHLCGGATYGLSHCAFTVTLYRKIAAPFLVGQSLMIYPPQVSKCLPCERSPTRAHLMRYGVSASWLHHVCNLFGQNKLASIVADEDAVVKRPQ